LSFTIFSSALTAARTPSAFHAPGFRLSMSIAACLPADFQMVARMCQRG
jgi:hypothetical protein